ncbi:MAG: phosphoenolpyruvate---glycerone phosphotransferase subunit DhaL, partial [Pseudonocardiales bacterium]|nr:phosphoenolpyruvate---glycerone phosphotransferase subunit DhaL [Pseudonocardiales bacterium]
DSLIPMTDTIEETLAAQPASTAAEIAKAAAATARATADATSRMQAMRGRASYTGERSIGSPDAGAVAVAVMAERIADTWPA